MHRYARQIGGLSHQSSDLSCLRNPLWKVVIRALLDTEFKGIQVVTYPTNCQTTKVMLTKVFPKSLGACTWINKVNSSSRIYSCSIRGTDIARVEGQWLNNGPNHSVPETHMTALRLELVFLIYFPPPCMSNHCDITLWHHNHLLYFFCGKTTAHAQRKYIICLHICQHHCWNPQLLLLHPNCIVFSLIKISCLWHSPPGISVHPHTRALNLITTF